MIWLLFGFYLILRLYPYFLSPVPLGYDPGLYLYLWRHDLSIDWLKQVYPPLIFWLGKLLSIFTDPANFLIPLSFVVASILFYSIYLYTKSKATLFLLAISAVQYRFWWYYYIKNILAIAFIFFYLHFFQKKSKWAYLFVTLIVLLHQPTAIILFFFLLLQKNFKAIILFLLTFAAYYLPNYDQTLKQFIVGVASNFGTASGTFYDLPQALLLILPYLPFALISIKNKKNNLMTAGFILTLIIPLFGLFLSRRFIPFFDIFTIILAGYSLPKFKPYYFLLIIFSLFFVYKNSASLISYDEFYEIQQLQTVPEDAYLLVTDNEYTPWAYGYSGLKPITPGFGEYDTFWSYDQWVQFWDNHNQIELLKLLPQPLYIYSGDKSKRFFVGEGDCFTRFSWHVWKFNCY
ncbi:MAG TPA: hypothetical protein PK639_01150 [Candidatus Woesebacteria bacterium]|nr:hypothetical protein [Candidatus Woesebacteria bacterium]